MARGRSRGRQRELSAAVRALQKLGLTVTSVTVLPDESFTLKTATAPAAPEAGPAPPDGAGGSWDEAHA
jgi:hypothetical protein